MIRLFKSNNNKNAILGAILVMMVIVMFIYLRLPQSKDKPIESVYPEIAGIDLDKSYPETPEGLIELNNKIILALYCGGIKDTEIALAFAKQRKLFSKELLELNPFEERLAALTDDVVKNRETKKYIVGFETGGAVYEGLNRNICTIEVLQKTNTTANYSVKYHLILEDESWKILAWESSVAEELLQN